MQQKVLYFFCSQDCRFWSCISTIVKISATGPVIQVYSKLQLAVLYFNCCFYSCIFIVVKIEAAGRLLIAFQTAATGSLFSH
jgi:hypothetical protein